MTETPASPRPLELGDTVVEDNAADSRLGKSVRIVVAAILAVVVLILTVVLYGLLAGVINAPAPRTAQEFVLMRAKASVETSPTSGENWADYIDVLVAQKNYSGAAEVVSRARKAVGDRTSILAVNNAEINLLIAQEQYKKALDAADRSLEQDAAATEKLITSYAEKGITIRPGTPTPWASVTVDTLSYKAVAAVALKKYDVALDALTTALGVDPLAADVAAFRGRVYLMKADTESLESARKDFEYALQFIPDYPAAIEGLAEVEKLTGSNPSVDGSPDPTATP